MSGCTRRKLTSALGKGRAFERLDADRLCRDETSMICLGVGQAGPVSGRFILANSLNRGLSVLQA